MQSLRRHSTRVNAGSTADIAFLLLIFFLVTTTVSADKGILRKLPDDCPPITECLEDIAERNLLRLTLNDTQEIMIENEIVSIDVIKAFVEAFVDNNSLAQCDYCEGNQSLESSHDTKKAVISLSHNVLTKYHLFISVQDEISKAFYDLRARYTKGIYNKTPEQLTKFKLEVVKKDYPFVVSEVTLQRSN